jgi:Amino acid synthesis
MDIRRLLLIKDVVFAEGGLPALVPVTRVTACAVIANPLAGRALEDLHELVDFGAKLGELLSRESLSGLGKPAISYGKAAIVGVSGDIEHAAAILHPQMGKPIRGAVGGGQAIIPSNVKIGAVGACIDVPLGHKDNVWSFDQIDTVTVMVPNAPRPDEIVVMVALADGGRPRPRVSKSGAAPLRA